MECNLYFHDLFIKFIPMTISPGNRKSIFLIGVLFFVFGFVNLAQRNPDLLSEAACQLHSDIEAFFVTFAFIWPIFSGDPCAHILKRTGFKNGMALGCSSWRSVAAVRTGSQCRNFPLFLTGLFVQGWPCLVTDRLNPYISIIGPIESAAQRISIMGICNKTAGALSPLILGAVVLKNASALEARSITPLCG